MRGAEQLQLCCSLNEENHTHRDGHHCSNRLRVLLGLLFGACEARDRGSAARGACNPSGHSGCGGRGAGSGYGRARIRRVRRLNRRIRPIVRRIRPRIRTSIRYGQVNTIRHYANDKSYSVGNTVSLGEYDSS